MGNITTANDVSPLMHDLGPAAVVVDILKDRGMRSQTVGHRDARQSLLKI
jgi:hypothetical protein